MPSQTGMRLRAMRLAVWAEAKKLADTAASQNRAFDLGEQLLWDRLNKELDVLDYRLKVVLEAEKRSRTVPLQSSPAAQASWMASRIQGRYGPSGQENPDYPWIAKINYARRDPPPVLPAGCWHLIAF